MALALGLAIPAPKARFHQLPTWFSGLESWRPMWRGGQSRGPDGGSAVEVMGRVLQAPSAKPGVTSASRRSACPETACLSRVFRLSAQTGT